MFTPEVTVALDEIVAEAKAKAAEARELDAAADEAEAAGDTERAVELSAAATQAKADEGILAADWAQARARVERTSVVHDGFTGAGAGLAVWTLIAGIAVLVLTLPAIGVFGIDEWLRYRWSALVGGVGLAITMVPLGWIATIVRVAHVKFVAGVGAAFVLVAGGTIFASTRGTLAEFERNKSYDDIVQVSDDA